MFSLVPRCQVYILRPGPPFNQYSGYHFLGPRSVFGTSGGQPAERVDEHGRRLGRG